MHMTTLTVAVAGASGYAGGEVLRLLLGHPEVEIGALTGASNAGERLGTLQPHLVPLADRVARADHRRDALRPRRRLPRRCRTASPGRSPPRLGDDTVVIDCGADFRLDRPGRLGRSSTAATTPGTWPYGLPELPGQRDQLARRTPDRRPRLLPDRLHPGPGPGRRRRAGRARRGRGRRLAAPPAPARPPRPHLLGSEVMGNASAYGVGGVHRHTPEIVQNLGRRRRGRGAGQLHPAAGADAARHPRHLLGAAPGAVTADEAYDVYATAYADEPFVHLLPPGQWPQTKSVAGSNAVHLQVTVDEAAGRLVAVGAVDNLTKGTAGAAVQCMNLALGLPETTGLTTVGSRTVTERARSPSSSSPRRSPSSGSAPAPRCPPWARVVLAVLGHRDRDRDLGGLRRAQRADQEPRTQRPFTAFAGRRARSTSP